MNSDLKKTHIYQGFYFDNCIKEHFYPGNTFLAYKEDMDPGELIDLAYEILGDGEKGFMPKLTRTIESLLGEGNFVYDFWEFGPDFFSLYWWIRKDVYKEKLELVRQWAEYEEISQWVEINEEEV